MGVLFEEYRTEKLQPNTHLNLDFCFYEFIQVQS